jgi:hypothetical protein
MYKAGSPEPQEKKKSGRNRKSEELFFKFSKQLDSYIWLNFTCKYFKTKLIMCSTGNQDASDLWERLMWGVGERLGRVSCNAGGVPFLIWNLVMTIHGARHLQDAFYWSRSEKQAWGLHCFRAEFQQTLRNKYPHLKQMLAENRKREDIHVTYFVRWENPSANPGQDSTKKENHMWPKTWN